MKKALKILLKFWKKKSKENTRIVKSIKANTKPDWTVDNKIKALIASRYLNSVGKGENALELAEY